jgi:hypothetical protein
LTEKPEEQLRPVEVVAAIADADDDEAALEIERRYVTDTAEEDPGQVEEDPGQEAPR